MLTEVLPLSPSSSTKFCALIQGIWGFTPVPLYTINLQCDLVKGPVTVGIVQTLPMNGIHFLLGNDLAGDKVRADPVVSTEPISKVEAEIPQETYPGSFPACVVTRSASRATSEEKEVTIEVDNKDVLLSETSLKDLTQNSVSTRLKFDRNTLLREQHSDPVLKDLFDTVMSEEEVDSVPKEYFLKEGMLMRKWRPVNSLANEKWKVVNQIVIPSVYRPESLT